MNSKVMICKAFIGLMGLLSAAVTSAQVTCNSDSWLETLVAAPSATTATPQTLQAVWIDGQSLRWAAAKPLAEGEKIRLVGAPSGMLAPKVGEPLTGAQWTFPATPFAPSAQAAKRVNYLGASLDLQISADDAQVVSQNLAAQWLIVREDPAGKLVAAAPTQMGFAMDAWFAQAAAQQTLGAVAQASATQIAVWAPNARSVRLCVYPDAQSAGTETAMQRDAASGVWRHSLRGNAHGKFYTYLVETYVHGTGWIRTRVTDPYADSLNANSQRAAIIDWSRPELSPPGWANRALHAKAAARVKSSTDKVMYELHVRDFSITDESVPSQHRGKYLAFTYRNSRGMRQLARLSKAGVTDVHLLPVFDIATIPEIGCITPSIPNAAPDSDAQQAAVMAVAAKDCFNWGYDPLHYGATEGSYASNANDAIARIREFRAMVQAMNAVGLRVGMDVVLNHTPAHGLALHAVLDRLVPGYYQRLNAKGEVEQSTCCSNTASEHAMMERLMVDTSVRWVKHYRIDSFRFDLMGHHSRANMERVQAAVNAAAGRHIPIIGEGWNFGEVANGARFVQASQLSLNGSGIGTFSDRMRDAARGGAFNDDAKGLVARQGYLTGQFTAPNGAPGNSATREDLMRTADMIRVGLAGTIRDYPLLTYTGLTMPMSQIKYGDDPAAYASSPSEAVNYVDNHDNQTFWDIAAYKLPQNTSSAERARVQVLGVALVSLSQGVAYLHAGTELLRSKSMDRNSYDSGDWFNRIDWSMQTNHFGMGLPPKPDNESVWETIRPMLRNPNLRATSSDIAFANAMSQAFLKVRQSTSLLRLKTAQDVIERLKFFNTGPDQNPAVIAAHIQGKGYPGAAFNEIVYALNVDTQAHEIDAAALKPALATSGWKLHPALANALAVDARLKEARLAAGKLRVPARTAVVFVR